MSSEEEVARYHKFFRLELAIRLLALFGMGVMMFAPLLSLLVPINRNATEYVIMAGVIGAAFSMSMFSAGVLFAVKKARYRFRSHILMSIALGEIARLRSSIGEGPIVYVQQRALSVNFRYLRIATLFYKADRTFTRIEKTWLSDFRKAIPIVKEFVLTAGKESFSTIEPDLVEMSQAIRVNSLPAFMQAYGRMNARLEGMKEFNLIKANYLKAELTNKVEVATDRAYNVAIRIAKFITPVGSIVAFIIILYRVANGDVDDILRFLGKDKSD